MADATQSVTIDGAALEGGGHVVRACVSLAWTLGVPMTIRSIRAGRSKPGLHAQHCASVRLASALSHRRLEGDSLGSTQLRVAPGSEAVPLPPELVADAQTAGSTMLMLQAALPPLLFCTSVPPTLTLRGGTDVDFAPPVAHASLVLAPLLRNFGALVEFDVVRRGWFPRGGGEVRVRASLVEAEGAPPGLRALELHARGRPTRVTGEVAGPEGAVEELRAEVEAAIRKLGALRGVPLAIELGGAAGGQAEGRGGRGSKGRGGKGRGGRTKQRPAACSVQLVVHTDTGCHLSVNALRPASEHLAGEIAAAATALLESGACVDEHTADQLVVFMALAHGTSRLRVPTIATMRSQHLVTAIHYASALTGARARISEPDAPGGSQVLEIEGVGATPGVSGWRAPPLFAASSLSSDHHHMLPPAQQ